MRKFNFDNLNDLNVDRIDLFTPFAEVMNFISPLNLSFAAPQPTPLSATIIGTTGDDTLIGTADDDTINGIGGDDIINGGAGNDILIGSVGRDSLLGDAGNDTLHMTSDDIVANGGAGDDVIRYIGADYSGSVRIDGSVGQDTLYLESAFTGSGINNFDFRGSMISRIETIETRAEASGADYTPMWLQMNWEQLADVTQILAYAADDIWIYGEANDDVDMTGIDVIGFGSYLFFGQAAVNSMTVDNENVRWSGTSGDNAMTLLYDPASYWNFVFSGGDGFDTIDFSGMSAIPDGMGGFDGLLTVDLADGTVILTGTRVSTDGNGTFSSIEHFQGWNGENNLSGSAVDDTLEGGDYDDLFEGRGGDDILDGGGGMDVAVYSSADTADYIITEYSPGTYTVQAIGGTGEGIDTLTNIETVRLGGLNGTDYDISTLRVTGTINLTNGDDTYTANTDEIVNALDGDDVLFVNGDNVSLNGGAGSDTADYSLAQGRILIDILTNARDFEAIGDVLLSIENLTGGDFSDALRGDNDDNVLNGGGDTDFLNGRGGNDTLIGGSGDDDINGGFGDDVLFGDEGDDILRAEGGDDRLYGGEGRDILNGKDGDDLLFGGEGDDRIAGGDGVDVAVYTSANLADYEFTVSEGGTPSVTGIGAGAVDGSDTVTSIEYFRLGGENGTDYLFSDVFGFNLVNLTNNEDIYNGSAADELINAFRGDDIIDGGSGINTLNGGFGNDILISLGNDTLNGGYGNDTVEMGGNDFDTATATDGGQNIDTISFSTLAQLPSGNLFLVIDLQGQAYSVRDGSTILYVDQFINFENATGSEYKDLLQGDADANVLSGLGGDDNLQGRDGDDTIDGGAGADILNGGGGTDTASYVSALAGLTAIMGDASLNTGDAAGDSYIDIENITGSDFDDILGGDANANVIDGGAGFDIASYVYASAAIVFDGLGLVTASGDITADTLVNIEAIGGTNFDDRLFGDNDASIFYGGEGNDRLFGRNGDDMLYGEGGDDILLGGRDNDLIDGGAGNDQLRGNEGDDTIFGGDGNDVLAGGAGADVMDGGAGIDRVEYTYGTNAGVTASLGNSAINTGDAAGDTYLNIENLYGTTFADTLHGDAGNNRIDGRLGDDMLFGGEGNDYLIGGAGDDVMNGEAGNDLFLGQAGADIYQFDGSHGTDRIVVFAQGEDLIKFTEGVFDFSGLTITQDGAHVNIVTSEGTIIANNSLVADFTEADFIFAPPPAQEPLQEPLDVLEQDMAMFIEVDALI